MICQECECEVTVKGCECVPRELEKPTGTQVMRVEFDGSGETIRLNGITMSLALLQMITKPNPETFLRFERKGNDVVVSQYRFESTPPRGMMLRRCGG